MRILVADDDTAMLAAYRTAFSAAAKAPDSEGLSAMARALFAKETDALSAPASYEAAFDVSYATQGVEAVALIEAALREGNPYQVVFLDMRMPPGISGKDTAQRIRAVDPNTNIVMVTGYSDHSPLDVASVAGPLSKLYYIAKPFEIDEVLQIARALGEKWQTERDLVKAREAIAQQLELLRQTNAQLSASEARAVHAAFHDFLTGAPNRAAFVRALGEWKQSAPGRYSTAILDLDKFKAVNDSLGHAAGDELIRTVYQRLNDSAPAGSICARLGGDEFGIILPTAEPHAVAAACETILDACCAPMQLLGHSMTTGASIGAARSESEERDNVDIIRRADIALYAAKRNGRGQFKLFDAGLDESSRFRRQIEAGLREAIRGDQLRLHFQPIVSQESLDTVGFEALVRWLSPEHGEISPALFVPIAEESTLIHELTDWVLPRALQACKTWPHEYVSVNFSPRQFRRPTIVEYISQQAAAAGVPPHRVQIEITETALFDDMDLAEQILNGLRARGFRVALDDFGTGYSSLFNLKHFSIDCIKIDKSFVSALGQEKNATAIVSSITQLARSLGMSVVAEGVEDQFQEQALRLSGCSHMQGFRFGRPAEEAALARPAANDEAQPDSSSDQTVRAQA